MNLQKKVEAYKLIARDALRQELINPRLTKISGYENEITDIKANKAKVEHEVEVLTYELSVLDKKHPDYEETKKENEEYLKTVTESLPKFDKEVEEVTTKIKEQNDAIAKIVSGETKVCLDALNTLVSEMIRKDALNQVAEVTA